ncbi:MAG: bifunctional DNA-formamidopyrimidine glycosylase/DNA-(apurinic or apyrimidinic site) lyase [Patescibacteria group bacterium]|nr:bifunctional DNA-formamidopyrimidine glycosylase/DNA-(apurinic or apyrimidinic site) lyase [Patescibacteria group bacterium]
MPELPEVETVRRGLEGLIIGRTIAAVTFDTPKSFPNAPADVQAFLINSSVVTVSRRAKVLLIGLSSHYSLVVHLKMTGQLVYVGDGERFGAGHPNASLIGQLPDTSTRVTLTFSDGTTLYFNDQRKFGWMRLLPTTEIANLDFFKKVGPEPLSADFSWQILRDRLQRRKNTNIKAALLDQTVVAGIGNIYADESLWGAAIHPSTLVKNVPAKKFEPLFSAMQAVLRKSIAEGGSSDKNYVNAEGNRGRYLTFAAVFRKEGQPCPRCGTIIIKTRVAGRGTHTCPQCQKLAKQ